MGDTWRVAIRSTAVPVAPLVEATGEPKRVQFALNGESAQVLANASPEDLKFALETGLPSIGRVHVLVSEPSSASANDAFS